MIYASRRMIFLLCKNDMISVFPMCRRHISFAAGEYHAHGISSVLQKTDIIEKSSLHKQ